MKTRWWAALVAVAMLGGCTAEPTPPANPTASAQELAQEEQVPVGFYRKPKDGEVCKKVDLAPLKAVVPGFTLGAANGVFQNSLKCDYVAGPLDVDFHVTMFQYAEQAAKAHATALNYRPGLRPITLPNSKAEAMAGAEGVGVYEQNLELFGRAVAIDKTPVPAGLAEAAIRIADDLLIVLRKELQSTSGPSASAQPVRERRVVSPAAVHGRLGANLNESQLYKIVMLFQFDLDDLDASPAVATAYGSAKDNNLLIFAATIAVLKTEARIDATLTRLAREGVTMTRPTTDKLNTWSEIRCGDGKIKEFTGALCLWRDDDSIGIAAFPGQKPADVKADFLTLRELVTKG